MVGTTSPTVGSMILTEKGLMSSIIFLQTESK